MVKSINRYNSLTDRQCFRSQRSYLTALTDVIEDIRNSKNDGRITFLVLLDHSKPFDTVHHSILCFKQFRIFNFFIIAVRLMYTYLTDFALQWVFRRAPYRDHYCIPFMLTIYQCSSNILSGYSFRGFKSKRK